MLHVKERRWKKIEKQREEKHGVFFINMLHKTVCNN